MKKKLFSHLHLRLNGPHIAGVINTTGAQHIESASDEIVSSQRLQFIIADVAFSSFRGPTMCNKHIMNVLPSSYILFTSAALISSSAANLS